MPTLLMLHGLTGNGNMIRDFAKKICPDNVTLITPDAPFKNEVRGFGWWDFPRKNEIELHKQIQFSIKYLLKIIPKDDPLIIGGFSQGAALALELLFSEINSRVVGLLILSSRSVDVSNLSAKLNLVESGRIFWMHGKTDHRIPFEEGEKVLKIFENTNWEIKRIIHEKGHMIPTEFNNDIKEWLTLFSN